jgi:hypothetical protein
MSLRSPTEDENGGIPLGTVFPQFVIPAHAGIQVCSPPPISLDTRFRGYDGSGRLAYCGSSLIGHPRSVFSKDRTRLRSSLTVKILIFVPASESRHKQFTTKACVTKIFYSELARQKF